MIETQTRAIEYERLKASQRIRLVQVRALVFAAQYQSFSKAAAELQLSQPTLSRLIKELEEALGVELFLRSASGVQLSKDGEAILPKAMQLLDAHDRALAFIASRRPIHGRTLRLAVDASIGPVIASCLQANLRRDRGGAALQMAVMGSEEAVDEVCDRTATFALCGETHGRAELRYTPILRAEMGLIVPEGCALRQPLRSLEDLDGLTVVRLADCTPVTQALRRHGVTFRAYFESPIVFTCLSAAFDLMREQKAVAVATGIGASLQQVSDMRFLPLPDLLPAITVYLVSSRSSGDDAKLEHVRDLIRISVHESAWHPCVERLNRLRQAS